MKFTIIMLTVTIQLNRATQNVSINSTEITFSGRIMILGYFSSCYWGDKDIINLLENITNFMLFNLVKDYIPNILS